MCTTGASPLDEYLVWVKDMSSATYPRGGRGLEVDSGVGIRLGLASDLTLVPTNQKINHNNESDMGLFQLIGVHPHSGVI